MLRLACFQSHVAFGDPLKNSESAAKKLESASRDDVQLGVFPEAALTGYCVEEIPKAAAIAIGRGDRSLKLLNEASQDLGIASVIGFAERSEQGLLYNTAVLFEKDRQPRFYRKTHLPELGLDKCVEPGNELSVFDTSFGKIGILICFDLRHPEPSRVLALRGAELIVLPTNWPEGAEISAEFVAVARAAENRVYMAACNRVGEEHGFKFIGKSRIVAPNGKSIAVAGDQEESIRADIDLSEARQKQSVMIPGKYETNAFNSRRPELYGDLVAPVQ